MFLPGPELSIIVPTFNERDNIVRLVDLLEQCLGGMQWELIVVDDDSPDRTAEVVRNLACADHRVRCLQRIGRRGLSSACIEGMLSSSAPFVAVMDGKNDHAKSFYMGATPKSAPAWLCHSSGSSRDGIAPR